ncbi:Transcription factor betaFTZ-F1 [Operophtera brumata]|uniref:Transcription factor betaFTZ-F1 n=1 Tax=Operophtera brumata TaxID=104452 RepID=A0A0L7LAC2_OPEBR|nr:Transcription factor betaFTZ-F1 [Operophtera brumata]
MHEDAPKMSVAHSLVASTSEPKSDIATEVPIDYDMSSTEEEQPESINLDLKIAYVDPASEYCLGNNSLLSAGLVCDLLTQFRGRLAELCNLHSKQRRNGFIPRLDPLIDAQRA